MTDVKTWLLLIRTPNINWKKFSGILALDPKLEILSTHPLPLLKQRGFNEEQLAFWRSPPEKILETDQIWLNFTNHHLVTFLDSDYPQLLKEIPDPPLALFVIGDRALLSYPQLAIVGSRNPSNLGRDIAQQFAHYLAAAGLTITSGLALGIDAAAHEGALAANGKTIAVCGTGLDTVYPARHRDLAERISRTGAIVSEFPLGTKPDPYNFPQRNRIISGLSMGTLVVEAALRSGSLITAHAALEQGREVFAIPGSIHNPLAKGCHQLIRQGAKLVETGQDIVEDLGSLLGILAPTLTLPREYTREGKRDSNYGGAIPSPCALKGYASGGGLGWGQLDKDYQRLLDLIGYETTAVDTLVIQSALSAEVVASMLLMLELQSLISSQPGGYIRTS
jgi:DNA processing protein